MKALLFIAVLAVAPLGIAFAQSDAQICSDVTIQSGSKSFVLHSGQKVEVLNGNEQTTVVSIKLPDGTSVITQIPSSSLRAVLSNDVKNNARDVVQETLKPAGGNSTNNAFTIVPKSAEAPTLSPLVNQGSNEQTAENASVSEEKPSLLSQLGYPIRIGQPDFPEPDSSLSVRQRYLDLPEHGDLQDKVRIVYDMPLKADGSPGPRAQHIVLYCPWYREKNPLDEAFCRFFCENLGLTIVSFEIKWSPTDETPEDQRLDFELGHSQNLGLSGTKNPEDLVNGNYTAQDVYGQIALEAQDALREKYNFKQESLIVVGLSSGSDLAEIIALNHSDKVAAAVLMSGDKLAIPTGGRSLAWLIMDTRGDTNVPANEALVTGLQKIGCRPIGLVTEPQWEGPDWRTRAFGLFHHEMSDSAFRLCEGYVWDISKLLEASNDLVHSCSSWPFLSDSNSPAKVYSRPSGLDDKLPESYCFVPGKASTYYYQRLQVHRLETSSSYKDRIWTISPTIPARGVVVYDDEFDYASISRVIDDMYYLSDFGYYVFFTASPSTNLPDLVQWIKNNPQTQDRPLYAMVLNAKTTDFLKQAQGSMKGCFKAVALINYKFPQDGPINSSVASIDLKNLRTDCPLLFAFDRSLSGLTQNQITELTRTDEGETAKGVRPDFIFGDNPTGDENVTAQKFTSAARLLFDHSR